MLLTGESLTETIMNRFVELAHRYLRDVAKPDHNADMTEAMPDWDRTVDEMKEIAPGLFKRGDNRAKEAFEAGQRAEQEMRKAEDKVKEVGFSLFLVPSDSHRRQWAGKGKWVDITLCFADEREILVRREYRTSS
jgi:hypothetical protein